MRRRSTNSIASSASATWKSSGLKKICISLTHDERREILGRNAEGISLARRSELLGISRQGLYYQPINPDADKPTMDALDEIYTNYPFLGVPKVRIVLARDYGIAAGVDRVRRLMRLMGLMAIYPKPNLSKPSPAYKYPYLLKHLTLTQPNQVWATDITYIRLERGWAYLIAVIDWFSRYILSWKLSETLELPFCLEVLRDAIAHHGTPEIFNTDQGSHFTADAWIAILKEHKIRISMDGRGRCWDNIFTERFWRTLKCENVYLKGYVDFPEAFSGIGEYMATYNTVRPHQSLSYKTPCDVHMNTPRNDRKLLLVATPEANHAVNGILSNNTNSPALLPEVIHPNQAKELS